MDVTGEGAGPWANPGWHWPEYPPGSVVEIRVHGVGGEPPSGMTRDPHPVQVGGDDMVGVHRARDPVVSHLSEEDGGPLHVREVLAWGGQTSGSLRHAFWVLLLPFALFNAAGRMHVADDPARARRHRATCRVLALTLTLSVVALTCGVVFDLVAVQCGGWGVSCLGEASDGPLLLAPVRRYAGDVVGRLGIVALVPFLVVVGTWYAGRYGTRRLEGHATDPDHESDRAQEESTRLSDHDLWRNAWPTSRLRALHASTAFAWVAGTLALSVLLVQPVATPVWTAVILLEVVVIAVGLRTAWLPDVAVPGPDPALHRRLAWLRLGGLGGLSALVACTTLGRVALEVGPFDDVALRWVLVVVGLATVVWWARGVRLPWRERPGQGGAFQLSRRDQPDVGIGGNLVLLVGAALVGWGLGRILESRLLADAQPLRAPDLAHPLHLPEWAAGAVRDVLPGLFPGPYIPLLLLVLVQILLLVLLAAVAHDRSAARREDQGALDEGHPVWRNLAAVVVALLSLLVITAVGAGLHGLVLDALGRRVPASVSQGFGGTGVRLVLPWFLALTSLVVALVLPVTGAVAWWWFARRRRSLEPDEFDVAEHLRAAYAEAGLAPGPVPSERADADRLEAIAGAWMTQRLVRDAGHVLFAAVAMATATVVAALLLLPVRDGGVASPLPLTTASMWVVTGIPVAGFALIRSSLQDRGTRRNVGRLWDVLTFWPRVTHPFAPPCYGEALVPMLEERIRLVAEHHQRRVVVAGHSQGSVVSLAVVARLPVDLRGRVALVSYGSPVSVLYERFFRATVAGTGPVPDLYDHALGRVRSWHHLYAMTEPFAVPFWEVPDAPSDGAAAGWPVNLALSSALSEDCPACASNPDEPAARRRVELRVRDPEQWRQPDGSPMRASGHSSYHRHRDVDRHLARIARSFDDAPSP